MNNRIWAYDSPNRLLGNPDAFVGWYARSTATLGLRQLQDPAMVAAFVEDAVRVHALGKLVGLRIIADWPSCIPDGAKTVNGYPDLIDWVNDPNAFDAYVDTVSTVVDALADRGVELAFLDGPALYGRLGEPNIDDARAKAIGDGSAARGYQIAADQTFIMTRILAAIMRGRILVNIGGSSLFSEPYLTKVRTLYADSDYVLGIRQDSLGVNRIANAYVKPLRFLGARVESRPDGKLVVTSSPHRFWFGEVSWASIQAQPSNPKAKTWVTEGIPTDEIIGDDGEVARAGVTDVGNMGLEYTARQIVYSPAASSLRSEFLAQSSSIPDDGSDPGPEDPDDGDDLAERVEALDAEFDEFYARVRLAFEVLTATVRLLATTTATTAEAFDEFAKVLEEIDFDLDQDEDA